MPMKPEMIEPDAPAPLNNVQSDVRSGLYDHLCALEGVRNPITAPEAHERAREYVAERLGQFGQVSQISFQRSGAAGVNVLLRMPGSKEGPAFLVGAHYDTVPGSPGADDNASGVSVMLEVARLCARMELPFPVLFAAFDLEERGPVGRGALGSQAMARDLRLAGEQLAVAFSLEMIGVCDRSGATQRYPLPFRWFYPPRADFLLMLGNPRARAWIKSLRNALNSEAIPTERFLIPGRGWPFPATRRSDHASFWDQGYSGVLLTDTAFLRNPHYHRPTDTKETLDLEFMEGIARGLAGFLLNPLTGLLPEPLTGQEVALPAAL